jgi:hypothetical protein
MENNGMGGDQLEETKVKTQYKILSKKRKHLWDTQMHLQIIDEAQAMVDEEDNHEDSPSDEKDCEWI